MTNTSKLVLTVLTGPSVTRQELAAQMATVVDDFNTAHRVWSDPESSLDEADFALRVMAACERDRAVIRVRVRAL